MSLARHFARFARRKARKRELEVEAPRGVILDREGRPLVLGELVDQRGDLVEFACHEGNRPMLGMLAAARERGLVRITVPEFEPRGTSTSTSITASPNFS